MTDTILQLSPDDILTDDNSRFGLKKYRIERLAGEILQAGGVNTPVEVQEVDPKEHDGYKYRLTAGFYRHAAVSLLNENDKAGLTLPCIVYNPQNEAERLRRQIAENTERENQSPMDRAIAIKKLAESGASKMDIRKIFAIPGGRKGITMQPASNSYINQMNYLLDLPKNVQERIHDGRITVGGAFELIRVHRQGGADKLKEVLEKLEAARQKDIDTDEKEEEKFLASQKKLTEAAEKEEVAAKEAEVARVAAEQAAKLADQKLQEAAEAYKASKGKGLDADARKKVEEHFKAAEAESKSAVAVADKAKTAAEKLIEKASTAAKKAEEIKAKLEEARKKKDSQGTKAVQTAVAQTPGATTAQSGVVKLNAMEMRTVVEELCLPGGYTNVQAIGEAFRDCFNSRTTRGQLSVVLAKITGEYVAPAAKGAAKKK